MNFRSLLIYFCCIFFSVRISAQLLSIPNNKVSFSLNSDKYLIGYERQFSSGLGIQGLWTTQITTSSQENSTIFLGPSFSFRDQQNTNWGITVATGFWTQLAFNKKSLNPEHALILNIHNKVTDDYSIMGSVNVQKNQNYNFASMGLLYHLGNNSFNASDYSILPHLNIAFTYGGNMNGHILILESRILNKLGLHAALLTDELHPSSRMTDTYYLGPSLCLDDKFLGPFDLNISFGVSTTGLIYNFPNYPLSSSSSIKLDYNLKNHFAISTGRITITSQKSNYNYLGFCYTL